MNIMNCLHGHAWIVEPAVYLPKTTDEALTRQILKSTPVIGDHHTTGKSWYNLSKTSKKNLITCIYFALLILSKGTVSQRGGFKYRFHKFAHGCIVEPAVIPPKKMDDAPTQQLLKSTPVTGEEHIKGKSR